MLKQRNEIIHKHVTTHLKKTLFYISTILLLLVTNGFSQTDFTKIDVNARKVVYNPNKSLAKELTKECSTELKKVRAIFVWIADNIAYDFDLLQNNQLRTELYTSEINVIEQTLNTKKAICSGYSYLFKELCEEVGIECVSIDGFSRQFLDGFSEKEIPDHSWNAVKISNEWYLLDVTWASGNGFGNRFDKKLDEFWFLTDPEEFKYTHFPSDQKWTLLNREFTKKDFYQLPTTVSSRLFTNGIKIIEPKIGTVKIDTDNFVIFKILMENVNQEITFNGTPSQTYASINNLPKPTIEEFKKDSDKYGLVIPSLELLSREINGNKVTFKLKIKHKSLNKIWISINGMQTVEYNVVSE